jgi:hypothetical protein
MEKSATIEEAIDALMEFTRSSDRGRTFGCQFIKRTNGEIRDMVAQFRGTRRHLAHGDQAYVFKDKRLLPVADMAIAQKISELEAIGMTTEDAYDAVGKPFRSIPYDNILRLTINGITYLISQPQAQG